MRLTTVPRIILLCVALPSLLCGCTTPPDVKQALIAKDALYSENLKLMRSYRSLASSYERRAAQWSVYTNTRALTLVSLKWITGAETDPQKAGAAAFLLGDQLVDQVKKLRFGGLPSVAFSYKDADGNDITDSFAVGDALAAGDDHMSRLIRTMPAIVRLSRERAAELSTQSDDPERMNAFDDYAKNVGALQQINAVVQGYLQIDVTVKPEDIKEISDSIKELNK